MPVIHKQYFDFGSTEVRIVEKGLAESCIHGWPAIAVPFFQLYTSKFVHRLIVLSGGKNPRGKWAKPEPDGDKDGIPTMLLRARTIWDR